MPAFGTASLSRLATCHDDLQRVMADAIATGPIDFSIVAGHREQAEVIAKIATKLAGE